MKRRTPGRIAAALIALGIAPGASASVTCIAPNPVCAVVVVGGVVTALVHARQEPGPAASRTDSAARRPAVDEDGRAAAGDGREAVPPIGYRAKGRL